jgi:hypothetical protein
MKHKQELPKSRINFFYILLILFYGCKNHEHSDITIYFFYEHFESSTPIITCEDMNTFSGIRKVKVTKDSDLYVKLLDIKSNVEFIEISYPDIRYKIKIKDKFYCMSYNGYFIDNHNNTGRIIFVNEIEDYINIDKSEQFTEP